MGMQRLEAWIFGSACLSSKPGGTGEVPRFLDIDWDTMPRCG
jgi:hypothetical protein